MFISKSKKISNVFNENFEYNTKMLIQILSDKYSYEYFCYLLNYAYSVNKSKINFDMNLIFNNDDSVYNDKNIMVKSFYIHEYYKYNDLVFPKINYNIEILDQKKIDKINKFYKENDNKFTLLYLIMKSPNKVINIINNYKNIDDEDNNTKKNEANINKNRENADKILTNNNDKIDEHNDKINEHNDLNKDDDDTNFIDVGKYFMNSMSQNNRTGFGWQSIVKFFEITDNSKNIINDILKHKIDNIIVKKEYKECSDSTAIKLGGSVNQMNNEINSLIKLYKKPHFPILLSKNTNDKYIFMNDCGIQINSNNIPNDWKNQMYEIIKTLKVYNIYNNDMYQNNFLVKDNVIYLVDFGWAKEKDYYPFLNIKTDDVKKCENMIELLSHVYSREYYKRSKISSII